MAAERRQGERGTAVRLAKVRVDSFPVIALHCAVAWRSEAASASPNGVPYTAGTWFNDLYPSSGTCACDLPPLQHAHAQGQTACARTCTFPCILMMN